MPIAGAGFGAAKALEHILGEQMIRAQMLQREREAEARLRMEQERLTESRRQADMDAGQRQQELDMRAGDRRQRSNVQETRRMLSDAIMQRQGPMTPDDRRGLATLQIEAGDTPTLLEEPKVQKYPVVTKGPNGRPTRRLVTEEELAQGVEEYREPPSSGSANFLTLIDGKGNQQRVPDGPQANQMLQQGWKIFDPVAARSSKPENNPEAIDTAREAKRLATDLLNSKGLDRAFGVWDAAMPTFNQDTADAEIIRDSLKDLLTVESMDKMKGVLSDSDMKILRSAATTLHGRMSEAAARRELGRIVEVMGRVAGEGPTAGLPSMNLATSRGNTAAPSAPTPANDIDALIERLRKPKR